MHAVCVKIAGITQRFCRHSPSQIFEAGENDCTDAILTVNNTRCTGLPISAIVLVEMGTRGPQNFMAVIYYVHEMDRFSTKINGNFSPGELAIQKFGPRTNFSPALVWLARCESIFIIPSYDTG